MPMPLDPSSPVIAHAIQFAIAPVFLLTGIAGLLGVMTNRLARVVDRARALERMWKELDETERAAARAEIRDLERRRTLASWSINFCTCAALLICVLIAALFVEDFLDTRVHWVAGVLFVGAMIALIGGLAAFLREVYLASRTLRIDAERFLE